MSLNHDRAAPKGLGAVKAAGNYAADIAPVHQAHGEGYNTTLYLDAKDRKFIEEFSVCNFVGITKEFSVRGVAGSIRFPVLEHLFVTAFVIFMHSSHHSECPNEGRPLRDTKV